MAGGFYLTAPTFFPYLPTMNEDMTSSYLKALTGAEDPVMDWRVIGEGEGLKSAENRRGRFSEHSEWLLSMNSQGCGIFVIVNKTDGRGFKGSNVTKIRALFVDDDNHSTVTLDDEGEISDIHTIEPPTFLVSSSKGKIHYYYTTDEVEVSEFKAIQEHLANIYDTDRAVKDPPRVMRVPGFFNMKAKYGDPRMVSFHQGTGKSLSKGEIESLWGTRDPVRVPNDIVEEGDPRFENVEYDERQVAAARSWLRQIVQDMEDIEEGSRNQLLFQNCLHARWLVFSRLLPHDEVFGLLSRTCRGVDPERGDEPVRNAFRHERELSEVFESFYNKLRAKRIEGNREIDFVTELFKTLVGDGWESRIKYDGSTFWVCQNNTWVGKPKDVFKAYFSRLEGFVYTNKKGEDKLLELFSHTIKSLLERATQVEEIRAESFASNLGRAVVVDNQALFYGKEENEIVTEPVRPDHYAIYEHDYALEGESNCDFLLEVLEDVWGTDEDAADKVRLLAEFYGACMLGFATSFQKALFLTGEGGNGKSTIMNILEKALFDPRAVASSKPEDWGAPYISDAMNGKLLNSVTEISEKNPKAYTAIKAFIVGDPVDARPIYGKPYRMSPIAGHVLSANRLPAISDTTEGFWRRMMVLEFNRPQGGKTVEWITYRCLKERDKIFRWALEGAERLVRQGEYTLPGSSLNAINIWRRDSDVVADWCHESNYAPAPTGQGDFRSTQGLYDSYRDDSQGSGRFTVSRSEFRRRMTALGFEQTRGSNKRGFLIAGKGQNESAA